MHGFFKLFSDGRVLFETRPSGILSERLSGFPHDQSIEHRFAESLRYWKQAGVDVRDLGTSDIRLADLPGATLATASGRTITLDVNAAGHGWFVDRTPKSDSEFQRASKPSGIDLLTVLMHEVGHLLGHDHEDDGLMDSTLSPGTRRTTYLDWLAVSDVVGDK